MSNSYDGRSSKSLPRSSAAMQTKCQGSGLLTAAEYEPMRHKRPSNEGLSHAVEQVRQIEEARKQNEAIQRAFSDEKMRNLELLDRQKAQDLHIASLEA